MLVDLRERKQLDMSVCVFVSMCVFACLSVCLAAGRW